MAVKKGRPTSRYQCVSRPGECKFEWNCGPLCACHVRPGTGKPQEKRDEVEAESRRERYYAKDAVTKLANVIDPP